MATRALRAVLASAWAILPEHLEIITSIAERENEFHGNLEALEAKLGRPLGNTMTATVRNGVATIPLEGPLFGKANLMTKFSGATSYDMVAKDFTAALEDPSVSAIVLNVDSPGGEVAGASELSGMIRAARGIKPIVAYVSGTMASAALWIGSAADRIVASDTALIGSVGAQMGMSVREPKAGEKSYRFVSSQSPYKNADPGTEAGAAQSQQIVDDLAQVFIDTLAANRGTTSQEVIAKYGQGAVFVADKALSNGMIDSVGSYEGVINSLIEDTTKMDYKSLTAAALAENRPDLVAAISEQAVASVAKPDLDAIRAEAATAERQRITEIEATAMPGCDDIIAAAKLDPTATAAATALKVLAHLRANPTAAAAPVVDANAAALANIQATEKELKAPNPAATQQGEVDIIEQALASASKAGVQIG